MLCLCSRTTGSTATLNLRIESIVPTPSCTCKTSVPTVLFQARACLQRFPRGHHCSSDTLSCDGVGEKRSSVVPRRRCRQQQEYQCQLW